MFFIAILNCIVLPVFANDATWTYTDTHAEIKGVAVSSTGSLIAVGAGKLWILSRNGTLLSKDYFGNDVSMTPDGSTIVSSYFSNLYFFERTDSPTVLKKLWETQFNENIHSAEISRNGKTVVLATDGSGMYIYDPAGTLMGYNDSFVSTVRTSARGDLIAGIPLNGIIEYYSDGRFLRNFDLSLISRPTNTLLSSQGTICVFNEDQKLYSVFTGNGSTAWDARATGNIMSLSMTPDGSSILAGTENGHIDHFDASGNVSWSYNANPGNKQNAGVTGVSVSDNGAYVVAGLFDGRILLLNSKGELQGSNQTKEHINHVAISADGSLAVATGDETVYALLTSPAAQPVLRRSPAKITTLPTPNATPVSKVSSATPPKKEATITTETPEEYSVILTNQEAGLPVSTIGLALVFVMIFIRLKT